MGRTEGIDHVLVNETQIFQLVRFFIRLSWLVQQLHCCKSIFITTLTLTVEPFTCLIPLICQFLISALSFIFHRLVDIILILYLLLIAIGLYKLSS